DVPMDAELVEYELRRWTLPFEARRVDTRDDFLRELADFRPDLILSDYTLPRFDGMAALRLARERAPSIPFLIVTGSVNEETAVGCMKAGATDYLLKSNLARIGPAIEAALARVQARTEQARAEEALRRSEANLRAIFDTSTQAFVLVDPDGTIQAMNPTARDWGQRILGHPAAEGAPIERFIPEAVDGFRLALRGETGCVERCLRQADGAEAWYEISHAPVADEAGTPIGVCLNARDVSERKWSEQALRESEARYRDLFDNASDLVCTTTLAGQFLYVNPAWHAAMGHDDAALAGLRFVDLVHPDSRKRYLDVVDRARAGESLGHVELGLVTAAGATLTLEGNISCTSTDGGPPRLRGIYRDVTERKRVEDQLRRAERMQAAGRLAGGVAHEVNNMMTGVIGFSEFLLRSLESDDPRRTEVTEIIKAGSRAADVTRQLLAFTRQQFLRPEVLSANAIVRDLEKMLRRLLGEDHTLELALDPDAGELRADRGQLEQVLVNLILNARDAMVRPGKVRLTTAAVQLDESYVAAHQGVDLPQGSYVRLTLSDSGLGMDQETQARIFEPFFTTKPVGQGTGLGLSTVYGVVKQSEGFVWVYSELGLGTTFKIYLPRVGAAPIQSVRTDHPPAARGGSETIMIVEDEEMVRELASRGLRALGYRVVEARQGAEALRRLEADPASVDLVISDVVMPEMGGRELARRLALLRPSLPILFISGYTGEDVIDRGLLEPGAPFEQKPFAPDGLARKVREMLDAGRTPAATRA
ncbi:MAG TPA: PAS domain S-box protein, partial [Gemmatimonadales bacterium]|nr:PAS domain S-box protein [Gemmatimonadales bacterium]